MAARELELILTHEHTDFDALASLLGAALLFPSATPVLPRQMNRNVREFLALYRSHLPFVQPGDLPRARIRKLYLVDTRALNAPRSLSDGCEVLVIDHHATLEEEPPRGRGQRAVPSTWQILSEPVGANTTLLVEKMIVARIEPSPLHATLLALGIHEDTGSLTYGGTTGRDARALAWLLEPQRGANLDVVNQFLHHPLGETQRVLLQQLIESSEFIQVEGHAIVIATADAPDFGEEISTVAARLRDFHEPDAVFIVINLGEMVQVVARSNTDEVDVGAVMRGLGGGGHARAAAAPIHGLSLVQVRDEIVRLLGEHARSAVTVRSIMSVGRPQSLSPEMTINEAAELMRRYGHEGFLVVTGESGDQVLHGVLTRREADRAINHGLGGEAVRRFMRAGRVTVRADDSIPVLRRTMIDSGWGQVPVVDENGQIMGIVTRTDLIKLWDDSEQAERPGADVERRLEATLPPVQLHLLRLVGEEVDEMAYTVYVVGGFVRDLLLNIPGRIARTFDLDIVIEGDAISFAQRMRQKYGGRIVQHRQFGTAKWLLDDPDAPVDRKRLLDGLESRLRQSPLPPHMDFVTARTEFYTAPTVLPTVESSSIKLDLHRRDFSINTLALCLNPDRWSQLLDFYGGLNDLRDRVVRVLHSLSFVDDPTRILRAARYEQRFSFRIDPRTLELIVDALEMLDRVTPARIRHEMERILQEAQPERILLRLDELDVLRRLHPHLRAGDWVERTFPVLRNAWYPPHSDDALSAEPLERLYWATLVFELPAEADDALNQRLGLRRETQRLVKGVRYLQHQLPRLRTPGIRPGEASAILDEAENAEIALLEVLIDEPDLRRLLQSYRREWQQIQPQLDGHALKVLGIPRGPVYRSLLAAVRAALRDGLISTPAQEIELVQSLAAAAASGRPVSGA